MRSKVFIKMFACDLKSTDVTKVCESQQVTSSPHTSTCKRLWCKHKQIPQSSPNDEATCFYRVLKLVL